MTASSYANLPKISVIMVTRNVVATVRRALESLVIQHYPKLELIIHDAASTDGTAEVFAHYSDLITLLVSVPDDGPPDAYNRAFHLTTGDFIGYLNADDEYEPGMLWAVAEAAIKNPETDVVTTGLIYRHVNRQGRRVVTGYYADEQQLEITLENVLSELPTFVLSRFIRRELAVKVGPYNTDRSLWYISCDREWMTRLALIPCRNVIVAKGLYGFEMHTTSISSNPDSFTRITEEHLLIAALLLNRPDLSEAHKRTIIRWQKRQLAYGLWKSLVQLKANKLLLFFKQGTHLAGWRFIPGAIALLGERSAKKIGLMLCRGIDRG